MIDIDKGAMVAFFNTDLLLHADDRDWIYISVEKCALHW